MPHISCSDLITLTNTFRTVLHNNDYRQHRCPISISNGNASGVLPSVERIM